MESKFLVQFFLISRQRPHTYPQVQRPAYDIPPGSYQPPFPVPPANLPPPIYPPGPVFPSHPPMAQPVWPSGTPHYPRGRYEQRPYYQPDL